MVDALDVPLLTAWLGRRRGWLVFSQIVLIAAIVCWGCAIPPLAWPVVFAAALLVATASATQDILIDAYRIESLPESEQAAGMASYVAAYRIGTLVSTAGMLFIVSGLRDLQFDLGSAWMLGYFAMAAIAVIGVADRGDRRASRTQSAAAEAEHAAHAARQSVPARAGGDRRRVPRFPDARDGDRRRCSSSCCSSSPTPSPAS